jgi:hypothetical protein
VKRSLLLLVVIAAFACSGHHSPTEPLSEVPRGTLSGVVTIGPICPVEKINDPCPTPPAAYAARKVLVETADATKVLFVVDIDSHGFYRIDLVPGTYTVDLQKNGIDRSAQVPAKVTIVGGGAAVQLDIAIDTGIR